MYFSEKEKLIIKPFFDYLSHRKKEQENYHMIWKYGTEIYSNVVSIDEDDNNLSMHDKNYEEYWVVVVSINAIIKFNKKDRFQQEWLKKDGLIGLSYRNFPNEIYNSKGELISKRED